MVVHWRPVGPQPVSTYWQRRAGVAAAVLLPLLLGLGLAGAGDSPSDTVASAEPSPSPPPNAPPNAPPPPAPSPAPSPSAAPAACSPTALTLDATAARDDYPVGGRPQLVLTITNTGSAPCTRDLGQGAVELLVVSGPDRIWSSDDCAPGGPAKQVVLDPREASVTRLTWAGRRSLPGCEGDEAVAQAGTYRVSGRVGDLRAAGSAFVLE